MPGMIRLGLTLSLLTVLSSPALGADPLGTMRAYCRADGLGDRLQPSTWANVASLVTWKLEPAWDRLLLIRGYEMGTPQLREDGVEVEVTYTVSAELDPERVRHEVRLENRIYRLTTEDKGEHWRVTGPPPVPHLFESQADVGELSSLLAPEDNAYVSSSAFVWHILKKAHPALPYLDTKSLASAPYLVETEEPAQGDVALYYDGEVVFHVGVVEADGLIMSATMNAGVWRGPPESFPGTVQYRTVDVEGVEGNPKDSPESATGTTPAAKTPAGAPL